MLPSRVLRWVFASQTFLMLFSWFYWTNIFRLTRWNTTLDSGEKSNQLVDYSCHIRRYRWRCTNFHQQGDNIFFWVSTCDYIRKREVLDCEKRSEDKNNITLETVLEHALMFHERAEQMVSLVRKSTKEPKFQQRLPYKDLFKQVVFVYRRKKKHGGHSPSQMMYGAFPRMIGDGQSSFLIEVFTVSTKEMDLMENLSRRAFNREQQAHKIKSWERNRSKI